MILIKEKFSLKFEYNNINEGVDINMHKKIIALTLICSVLGSGTFSTFAFATTNTNNITKTATTTNQIQKDSLSQTEINKVTPFIETTQSGFFLSKAGYSSLNSTEIKIVLESIDNSNTALKNASKTETLSKTGTTFFQNNTKLSIQSITAGVNKAVFHWWGISIYVSGNNVRLCAVGATGATGALVASIPGIGWSIAGGVAGAIAATMAGDHNYNAEIVSYYSVTQQFYVVNQ
jgi:hypothetical protein